MEWVRLGMGSRFDRKNGMAYATRKIRTDSEKTIGPQIQIRPNECQENVGLGLTFNMEGLKPQNIPFFPN